MRFPILLGLIGVTAFGSGALAQQSKPRPPETIKLPSAILSPKLPTAPDFDDEDDEEPELSLPLKDGLSMKGKLGSGWTFGNLPGTADQFDYLDNSKGRRFEIPGLRSEKHVTIGGRKSQANGLSFGFDFDLPH